MKQGIIFDMDGTLWDSSENVAKSWDEAVQRRYPGLRRIRAKDIKDVMGHTMTEIAKLLFPMLEEKEALHLTDVCGTEENAYLRLHGGVLYPDLQATLALLAKQYPLYIVSNCQKGYIEAFLDYYRLWDFFQDRECFGNTGREKAHNIALVVERNQLDAAVYVGDIQGDYDASTQAGDGVVHAAYGFGRIDGSVLSIGAFCELPDVAAAYFRGGLVGR